LKSIIPLKNVLNSALEWREGIFIDVKHPANFPNDIALEISQKVMHA
jgi:hypothetical protein